MVTKTAPFLFRIVSVGSQVASVAPFVSSVPSPSAVREACPYPPRGEGEVGRDTPPLLLC